MKIFTIPGLYNSGPRHWQTHWEKEFGYTRIEQKNWETPVCSDWMQTIDEFVMQYALNEVILVGHKPCLLYNCSLGKAIRAKNKRSFIGWAK